MKDTESMLLIAPMEEQKHSLHVSSSHKMINCHIFQTLIALGKKDKAHSAHCWVASDFLTSLNSLLNKQYREFSLTLMEYEWSKQ